MPIIAITDVADARLRVYRDLTDAQLRECATSKSGCIPELFADFPDGLFIAESKNVVLRALAAGFVPVSLFMEERWVNHEQELIELVAKDYPDVPAYVCSQQVFQQVTGMRVSRGALACFERKALVSVGELLAGATRVAILEDITNYTNMGAIFRSAAALGVDAVLVTPNCHDPLYRRAARVSMGTVFQVPWTRIEGGADWAGALVPRLREAGFVTVALALEEDSIPLNSPLLAECDKVAMVLGTEGEGLRASTIEACDHTVLIPMEHDVDSLNVAAASAVTFWELCKNRAR